MLQLLPTLLLQAADVAPDPARDSAWQTIWKQLFAMWKEFLTMLPQIAIALIVLTLTALVARLGSYIVGRVLRGAHVRGSLRNLAKQLVYIAVWIVGILAACTIIFPTLTPASLLATLGLTTIAIGFAFKDIFENFFAGILILWRFPLEINDFIECEGIMGKVEQITIRMTLIRQVDGQLVIVPNATLFKNAVHVLTSQPKRRISITCGVAYDVDVDAARSVIEKALAGCEQVDQQKPIQVFANEFAESSINFEIAWWTGSTPLDVRRSRDEVVAAVKRALDDAGMEIPFPYRTLTFKEPLHVAAPGRATNSPAADASGDGSGN